MFIYSIRLATLKKRKKKLTGIDTVSSTNIGTLDKYEQRQL